MWKSGKNERFESKRDGIAEASEHKPSLIHCAVVHSLKQVKKMLVPNVSQNTKTVYFKLFTQGRYKMDVALTRTGRL